MVEKNGAAETDGILYEINFTSEGEWTEIDGNNQEVPPDIIPENIANYIAENYSDLFVTGIDTEPNGFEVYLLNDIDINFDQEGKFVRYKG